MKKVFLTLTFVFIFCLLFPKVVDARSGCCSHHGGVCGCGCCDGTGLSNTCAPYYPECSQPVYVAPVVTARPTTPKPATPKPTIRATPTIAPTETPTVIPTPALEVKTVSTEVTPSPTPAPTAGSNVFGFGVLAILIAGGVWIYKKVNRKPTILPHNT